MGQDLRQHTDQLTAVLARDRQIATSEMVREASSVTRWLVPRLGKFLALKRGLHIEVSARSEPFDFEQSHFDLAEAGVDAEIIDLRSLLPLDLETISTSVRKTGRCVVVHDCSDSPSSSETHPTGSGGQGIVRSEVKEEGWRSQPGGHERRRVHVADDPRVWNQDNTQTRNA